MAPIKIILLLLLLKTQNCFSQRSIPDSLIEKFRSDVQIEQKEHSGVVVMDDETKGSYYLVISNSSIKELIKYTNDSNAFVRSYMFVGLLRKKVNKNALLNILDIHKNDTAKFTSKGADVVMEWTVKKFMQTGMDLKSANKLSDINYKKEIEKIRSQPVIKLKFDGIHHGLIVKKQLLKIDSLILTDKKFRVVSFTLFAAGQEMKSSGSNLTNDMKISIEKTRPGDSFLFDNIKVVNEDNIVRYIPPLSLKLQ